MGKYTNVDFIIPGDKTKIIDALLDKIRGILEGAPGASLQNKALVSLIGFINIPSDDEQAREWMKAFEILIENGLRQYTAYEMTRKDDVPSNNPESPSKN